MVRNVDLVRDAEWLQGWAILDHKLDVDLYQPG